MHCARLDDGSSPGDQRRSLFCKFVALFGSGEWRVAEWTSDVVRYRDGLSLVVRYTVAALRESTGSRGSRVFDAKAYPDRATVGATERFADEPGPPCGGHRGMMQAPIACPTDIGSLLFDATSGRPLDDLIERADEGC